MHRLLNDFFLRKLKSQSCIFINGKLSLLFGNLTKLFFRFLKHYRGLSDEPFDETPVQEEIPDEEVAETIEVPIPKSDTALIRILEDLPPFVGPDRDYELRKEDVVTLPRLMAQALINSEKAVEIDPSHRSSSCPPGTPDNLCSSF